jgi:dihydrofolate reductase
MGRQTYYDMAAWWPYSKEPFAPPMNEIPKAVFSQSESRCGDEESDVPCSRGCPSGAQSTGRRYDCSNHRGDAVMLTDPAVFPGDLANQITCLKQQPGKVIMAHGGAGFAQSLVRTGLVDENWLLVHPVALGRGQPLFSELPHREAFELVEASVFPSGAVGHVFRLHELLNGRRRRQIRRSGAAIPHAVVAAAATPERHDRQPPTRWA